MLRLTVCLLVIKTVLAAKAYPINDGSYVSVGPETNLVFNFEQIRRDQPPQIEMREENIHKYLNRPRTTPPTPIDDGDMSPMRPEHPLPYTGEQWEAVQKAPKYEGPVSMWKSVPAPPSFPSWDRLSVNNRHGDYNDYEQHQQRFAHESINQEPEYFETEFHSSSATPTFEPVTYAPVTYAPVTFAPVTFAPTTHAPDTYAPMHYGPRNSPRSSGRSRQRGNHRFDWRDVTTEAPSTFAPVSNPTTTSSRMPPPPVPTLSPWYDGF